MRIEPETSAVSIVMIGSFNPRIFRPEWFQKAGILGARETEAAKIRIIHEAVSAFSLDWGSIQVDQNRFSIDTADPPFIRIHDVVLKSFKEFLNHTPIYQLGINRLVHFSVGSFDIRDRIGRLLAPHEPWGKWASRIAGDPDKPHIRGGMRSLVMGQVDHGDGLQGSINAKVEPSVLLADGIYMDVNDHFVLGSPLVSES
jgi:hypothetical protein